MCGVRDAEQAKRMANGGNETLQQKDIPEGQTRCFYDAAHPSLWSLSSSGRSGSLSSVACYARATAS